MHLAEQILGAPATLVTKPGGGADARLVYQCNLLDIAIRGLDLCISGEELHALGAEQWVGRIRAEVKALNVWQQRLSPVVGKSLDPIFFLWVSTSYLILRGITPSYDIIALTDPSEMIQITTVTLQCHYLHLLLLFRAFRTIRRAFPHLTPIIALVTKGEYRDSGGLSPHLDGNMPLPNPPSPVLRATQSVNPNNLELDTDALMSRAAVEFARLSREAAERIMIESLTLRRHHMTQEPVISGEKVLPALAYVPDYVCYALFFAPIYTVKAHILAITLLQLLSPRHETTRSLLDRQIDMFREAAQSSSASSKTSGTATTTTKADSGGATAGDNDWSKELERKAKAANYLEIETSEGKIETFGKSPLPAIDPSVSDDVVESVTAVENGESMSVDPPTATSDTVGTESTGAAAAAAAGEADAKPAPAANPRLSRIASPPSDTLVGRCADVLSALVKLWDARTTEWFANEAAGVHDRHRLSDKVRSSVNGQPPTPQDRSGNSGGGGGGHGGRGGPRHHGGDEEEDELASDNGDSAPPVNTSSSLSGPPLSAGTPSSLGGLQPAPTAIGGPIELRSSTPAFGSGYAGGGFSSPANIAAQIGLDANQLLGTEFNFDLAPFYDPTFFDPMFMFDASLTPLDPSFVLG